MVGGCTMVLSGLGRGRGKGRKAKENIGEVNIFTGRRPEEGSADIET